MSTKNYRKAYKGFYKIDFDNKLYEIHHIDFDHNNNDIDNLLLLPKSLHREYHNLINQWPLLIEDGSKITIDLKIKGNQVSNNNLKIGLLEQLLPILTECNKWYDLKMKKYK